MLIVGNYLSPYVRKLLVWLELKGIACEIDPLVPVDGDDRHRRCGPRPFCRVAVGPAVWGDKRDAEQI